VCVWGGEMHNQQADSSVALPQHHWKEVAASFPQSSSPSHHPRQMWGVGPLAPSARGPTHHRRGARPAAAGPGSPPGRCPHPLPSADPRTLRAPLAPLRVPSAPPAAPAPHLALVFISVVAGRNSGGCLSAALPPTGPPSQLGEAGSCDRSPRGRAHLSRAPLLQLRRPLPATRGSPPPPSHRPRPRRRARRAQRRRRRRVRGRGPGGRPVPRGLAALVARMEGAGGVAGGARTAEPSLTREPHLLSTSENGTPLRGGNHIR
jgi:hypothetical protein